MEQATFRLLRKMFLYLERGPERYALAWRVSSTFSTIDGEETCSTRTFRRATQGI